MRTKGKIVSWNDSKGYGFVAPLDGSRQVFLHVSALSNRGRRPELNDLVTYALGNDSRGRSCAIDATLVESRPARRSPRRRGAHAALVSFVFLFTVGASALTGYLPMIVPAGCVILSLVTFVAYAIDKTAARRGTWRIPEATLLGLGLAGGWPGGLVAQELLRHKSKKKSFRVAFWFMAILNCAALLWLHIESRPGVLRNLLT